MDNHEDEDDVFEPSHGYEGPENRTYRRRATDRAEEITVDSFKLSLREVVVVVVALGSIGTTLMHFNSSLDKTDSEMTLKHELASTRITSLETSVARLEKKIEELGAQVSDNERTIMQMYTQRRKEWICVLDYA